MGGERVSNRLRQEAFRYYVEGFGITDIAKMVGVHRETIRKIKKQDNWEQRKEEIRKQTMQKVDRELIELSFEQLNKYALFAFNYVISQLKQDAELTKSSQADLIRCLIDLLKVAQELHLAQEYTQEIERNIEAIKINYTRIKNYENHTK